VLINFDFPFQNYELEVSNRVEHEGCVKRRNAKTQKRVKAEAKAKSFCTNVCSDNQTKKKRGEMYFCG